MKVFLFKAPKETHDDIDPYVNAFLEVGINAEALEVLSFQYINKEILEQKILKPECFGGFIFTSPRSVLAITNCLPDLSASVKTKLSILPSYVVGEGTAKVLSEKLGLIGIGQEAGSAQQLAKFIIEDARGRSQKPLLFPSASMNRSLLLVTLTEAGILVDNVSTYMTIPNPNLSFLLKEKFERDSMKPHIFVFFSPSGVNAVLPHLSNLIGNLQNCKIIAIGPTTENALRQLGVQVSATAEKPSPTGLLQAVQFVQINP